MVRLAVGSNKTSVVTVRLTPKEKFSLELLARKLHTNLAGAVMASVENMFREDVLGLLVQPADGRPPVTAIDAVWSPYEHERFAVLAETFPELLSDEETYAWRLVVEEPKYWKQVSVQGSGGKKQVSKIDLDKLEADWDRLKARAHIQS